ncbi:MAG: hypothetical protein HF976_11700 [ANME-2 cluster archaeon]|nr:hypothetical protein [ANME-2 cluster archaeon]MBC2746080.1 hypothetical protein [ANME-2 cluster archaeon]
MKEHSPGAFIAWQIAYEEAGMAKQQYIGQEHLLIGIGSLFHKPFTFFPVITMESNITGIDYVPFIRIDDKPHAHGSE